MVLKIDVNGVEKSFDKIAHELLNGSALLVNNKTVGFTEIEFYYFHKKIHEDNYTHIHERGEGEWRFHNQGLDITFQGDKEKDGGILIRGIKIDGEYINGPRNVVKMIFENFNKVTDKNELTLVSTEYKSNTIIKTFRHLPNKIQDSKFHSKHYRYLIDLDKLKIAAKEKVQIINDSEIV